MIHGSAWPSSCTMATWVRARLPVSATSSNLCSPRETLRQGRLAAVVEHEQVLLAAQPPAPAVIATPGDQGGRAIETIAHQRGAHPLGQQGGDGCHGVALLAKADGALRLLHAPSQRQGTRAH